MPDGDWEQLTNKVNQLLKGFRKTANQSFDSAGILSQKYEQKIASLESVFLLQPEIGTLLDLLRQKATTYSSRVILKDVGTVQHVGSGVATISGLWQVGTDELVDFPNKSQGLVLTLDHDQVDAVLLGPDEGIRGGDMVVSNGQRLLVPVGPQLAGRVLNALGDPLDQRGPVESADHQFVEQEAPGIIERSPVNRPLHTGTKLIDALLPIGRGQRELIVGDRQTGKTTLAVDTILNQKPGDVYCVYVAIGQKKSSTLRVIETLSQSGAMENTTVVVSGSDDPPAMRYLAPYTGCTMAEYMVHEGGKDALIIFDDLSKHADAYRELSLLLRRPPGREAYPGDIFYLHARLLERACHLSENAGGGSLSALPIVEIQRGNLSAYISTNLISITDGQIVLDSDQFNKGILPAIDVGRSVSRVGSAAQTEAMRAVAGDIRLVLAQYEEVARFARFGTQVDEATQRQIQEGRRLEAILTQPEHQPRSLGEQVAVLFAATQGFLDRIPPDEISNFEQKLISDMKEDHNDLLSQINRSGKLTDDLRHALHEALEMVINGILAA